MKISVIVPVYNCVKYLPDCLNSILKQTFDNLEIIIVDDGSNDGSAKICDEYALLDSRVCVIHQENRGVSAARNEGLKRVTGDVVSFVDSDDVLDLDMYEILIRFMCEYKADIVHCGYKRVDGNEVHLVHDTGQIHVQDSEEALRCLVGGYLFVGSLWNKLYKKSVLANLQFDENLKVNEDILFNFKAFSRSLRSVFVDQAKYNYIVHNGESACFSTSNEKKIKDSCAVNRYMYEQLKTTKLNNIATERYFRSLSCYYRFCAKACNNKCAEISVTMRNIWKETKNVGWRIKVTVWLILHWPWLYLSIYNVYDRIRTPQWDV